MITNLTCLLPNRSMDVPLYAMIFITTFVHAWAQKSGHPKCTLHILSALPYPSNSPSDYSDGPDIVPAGYLAIEMINNRSDILNNYHLKLIEGHDGCRDSSVVNLLMKNVFYGGKNIVGIAGPRCYVSSEVTGLITAKDGIALINVHTSSSPFLGNTSLYPYSFGSTSYIHTFVDAYVELMKLKEWKHVGVLYVEDAGSYSVLNTLNTKLSQMSGYEVAFSSTITNSYFPLGALQASSARAILVVVGVTLTRMLMCIAYANGAVFPGYQWTLLYRVPEQFVDTSFVYEGMSYNCSHTDLLLALKNSILIDFNYEPHSDDYNKRGISGLTYPQYQQEYARAVQRYNSGYYGPPVRVASTTKWGNPFHDAVWILALALNATDTRLKKYNKSLCEYGFGQPSVTNIIQEEVSRLDFLGVGGRIRYSNGSRFTEDVVDMWQVISNTSQPLGYFDEKLHITYTNATFLHPQEQKYQTDLLLSMIFLIVSILALILTAILHVLNIIFRNHESVKASSHRLNHMAYGGIYLLSLTIVMLTLTEGFSLPLPVKDVICIAVPWVSSIGFTAVYATLDLKLFRIYRLLIIAVEKLRKPSNIKMMRDPVLLVAIAILCIPDIVICTVWQIVDPIKVKSYSSLQKDTVEPIYVTYESCFVHSSKNILPWLLSLFIYNGILCCIATFIAFLTRSISERNFKTGNILLISALQLVLCGVSFPTLVILNLNTSQDQNFILSVYITTCLLHSSFVYLFLLLLFLPPLYLPLKYILSHTRQKLAIE